MSEVVRIGIVGAGAISKAYASAIEQLDEVRLTAIADIDAAAAHGLDGTGGAKTFRSHIDLASIEICDAVIVATPPNTHESVVIDLVKHGIPVLCEKPFAIDGPSARRMAAAAMESGVMAAMASKFRYVDDMIAAREMLAAGEIGEAKLIENVFTGVVDMTARWNAQKELSGGGVLIDNGTHSVDIVRFLVGPITSVSAIPGPRIQQVDVEDHVFMFARSASGVLAEIETSWSLHKDRRDYVGIYGTEGSIELGWKGSRIRRSLSGAWEDFGSGYDKIAAFSRQVSDFAAVVRGHEPSFLATLGDAIASVDVVTAGYASIAEGGKWTEISGAVNVPRLHSRRAAS